jgi:hypothetical protein
MPDPYDPSVLENLRLSPDEVPKIQNNGAPRKTRTRQRLFCQFDYERQLGLAKTSRAPLFALQAELYRLWFQAYDKTQPIELPNAIAKKLGFSRVSKNYALRRLEKTGWIKVEWRKGKAPLIRIIAF